MPLTNGRNFPHPNFKGTHLEKAKILDRLKVKAQQNVNTHQSDILSTNRNYQF